jgi:hypothetical protein
MDQIAIERGLKEELTEFAKYILYESTAPERYKNYKRKIYYLPEELVNL